MSSLDGVESGYLPRATAPTRRIWLAGLAVGVLWLGAASVAHFWPDADDWPYTNGLAGLEAALGSLLLLAALTESWLAGPARRLRRGAPWFAVLALLLTVWEIATAKLDYLPRPFFAPPQALIAVYVEDFPRLGSSVLHSLGLLA